MLCHSVILGSYFESTLQLHHLLVVHCLLRLAHSEGGRLATFCHYSVIKYVCCTVPVMDVLDRLESLTTLSAYWNHQQPVKLCLTALRDPQLALAGSVRRKGGLTLSVINFGRYIYHLCPVSVVEVSETLELNNATSVFKTYYNYAIFI